MTNSRHRLAQTLLSEGFNVIPLASDGKRPTRRWKQYQTEYATDSDLIEWFIDNNFTPAIVTGILSGITVIDCDDSDAIDMAESAGYHSDMTQRTSRGMHMVFRHAGERNTVRVDGMSSVDRRGEGGIIKAYPDSIHWKRYGVFLLRTIPNANTRQNTESGIIAH